MVASIAPEIISSLLFGKLSLQIQFQVQSNCKPHKTRNNIIALLNTIYHWHKDRENVRWKTKQQLCGLCPLIGHSVSRLYTIQRVHKYESETFSCVKVKNSTFRNMTTTTTNLGNHGHHKIHQVLSFPSMYGTVHFLI